MYKMIEGIKFIVLMSFVTYLLTLSSPIVHADLGDVGYMHFKSDSENYYVEMESSYVNFTSNVIDLEFSIIDTSDNNVTDVFDKVIVSDGGDEEITLVPSNGDTELQIVNFNTGLDKTEKDYEIEVKLVKGEEEDSVKIMLNYYHINSPGAKFYVDYSEEIEAFDGSVILEFPENSYIAYEESIESIAPEQVVNIHIEGKEPSTSRYVFLSNTFNIEAEDNTSNTPVPVKAGNITLKYESSASSNVAMYNISIVKKDENRNRWVPVGGFVSSKSKEVKTTFSGFGKYAVAINYETFGIPESNWSQPYILALAYKGILMPDQGLPILSHFTNESEFETALNNEINRFDYTVMLAKALGWAPVEYNNYFADVTKIANVSFEMGTISVPTDIAGTSNGNVDVSINDIDGNSTLSLGDEILLNLDNQVTSPANQKAIENVLSTMAIFGQNPTVEFDTATNEDITIALGPDNDLALGASFNVNEIVQLNGEYYSIDYDGTGYIMTAVSNGLLQGAGNRNGNNYMYLGDDQNNLTREQAAVFTSRALDLKVSTYSNMSDVDKELAKYYVDVDAISDWAKPYVAAITNAGLMQGEPVGDNQMRFNPTSNITVAQSSALVYRVMDELELFGK